MPYYVEGMFWVLVAYVGFGFLWDFFAAAVILITGLGSLFWMNLNSFAL